MNRDWPECKTFYELCDIPEKCPECSGDDFVYCELGIKDNNIKLSGKIDLLFRHKQIVVCEAKSVSGYYKIDQQHNVEKYFQTHRHQANAYLGILRQIKAQNSMEGFTLYHDGLGNLVEPTLFFAFLQRLNTEKIVLFYEDKFSNAIYGYDYAFDKDMYQGDRQAVKDFYALNTRQCLPDKRI